MIWVFLQLGRRLGNLEAGFGAMALFQMLLYSLVTAYCCVFLYRVTRRRWTVIAATLFFALLPLNTVLVVCTTKDVLFTILFLLFHLLLAERFFYSSGRKKLLMDALLVLVGVVMVQFRNNALYAVAIYAVIWLILAARKEKLRVLLVWGRPWGSRKRWGRRSWPPRWRCTASPYSSLRAWDMLTIRSFLPRCGG